MRVLLLTHDAERHYYFANTLIERTGSVVGVITGAKRSVRTRSNMALRLLDATRKGTASQVMRNALYRAIFPGWEHRLFQEKTDDESRVFGGAGNHFHNTHAHLLLDHVSEPHMSVNDPYYVKKIRTLQPDVIAVMGTCMLRRPIMESAPLVLNIHTGLSPYYRGGYTNLWPIIQKEYGFFGVTVHRMSLGIDSGAIVSTARVDTLPEDTYGTINSRSIVRGVELMEQALQDATNGTLQTLPQWTAGRLFFNRDMNDRIAYRYFQTVRPFLQEHCRRQAEGTLDAVQLVHNGQPVLTA